MDLSPLKDELEIIKINEFKLNLSLQKAISSKKFLLKDLNDALVNFKKIDPLFDEREYKTTKHDFVEYKFDFQLTDEKIEAFRKLFISPQKLFDSLYFFQILNIEKFSRNIARKVKNLDVGSVTTPKISTV